MQTEIPEITDARAANASNGRYLLLTSLQTRFKDQSRQIFVRYAENVLNRQGLEGAGYVSVSFRPGFDKIVFHSITIHRGEDRIELLETTRFRQFQRENDLEKGIIDGRMTAFANLPGVRVGDTIEVAYSITYSTILMPDEFFSRFTMSFTSPIALVERRALLPKALNPKIRYAGPKLEPVKQTIGAEISYTWSLRDPEPYAGEKNAPSWYDGKRSVDISTVESWADVSRDSISHYPGNPELPSGFRAKLAKINRTHPSPKSKVAAVLALVQNEVRYVGVEIGRGAFIPREPGLVIQRGYGDCKDKSYLMVAALNELGIEAVPVLAHLSRGAALSEVLPSPYAFDHVIVRARVGDDVYFLDPTGTEQYNPDPAYSQANYGFVLPVAVGSAGLEKIVPTTLHGPTVKIYERLRVSYEPTDPAITLSVRTTYRKTEADDFRRNLAGNGKAHYRRIYLKYYEGLYGDLEPVFPLTITDNRDGNIIRVDEKYRSKSHVDRETRFKELNLRGDAVSSLLSEVSDRKRSSPIALTHPLNRFHRIQVDNLAGPVTALDNTNINNEFVKMTLKSAAWQNSLSVEWTFRSKLDHLEPSVLADYIKTRSDIDGNVSWHYDVTEANLAPDKARSRNWPRDFVANYMFLLTPMRVW